MKLVKLLILSLVVLLVACSKQDKLENHIPENSIFLMKVNTPSMIKKVAWDALFSDGFFDLFDENKKTGESMRKMSKSGLDMTHEFYLFKTKEHFNEEFSMIFELDNKQQLITLLDSEGFKSKETAGIHRVLLENGVFLSFNDKVALLTITERMAFLDDLESKVITTSYSDHGKLYKDVIKSDHDVVSSSDYSEVLKTQVAAMTFKKNSFDVSVFEGDYIFGFIDFLDGKIVSDYNYFAGESSKSLIQSMEKENKIPELTKAGAGESPIASLGMSFNFESIVSFMRTNGILADIDKKAGILRLYGTSAEELLGFFKGDFLMCLESIQNKEVVKNSYRFNEAQGSMESYIDTVQTTTPVYIYSNTVNNEARLKQLMATFHTMLEDKGGYLSVKGGSDIYIRLEKEILSVTNSEDLMKDMIAGKELLIESDDKKGLSENAYFLDLRTNKCIPALKQFIPGMDKELNDVEDLIDGIQAKGAPSKEGFHYNTEVIFRNEDDNSLFQMFEFAKSLKQQEAA